MACRLGKLKKKLKPMRIALLLLLWYLTSEPIFCQDRMSWEQCAEYALENNLDLKAQDLKVKLNTLNINAAKNAFLPSIHGSMGFTNYYGRSIDPETNEIINRNFYSNRYGLNGSIAVFEGFSRINRLNFEKYNARYAKAEYEALQNETVFRVFECYFNTIFYKGLYTIAIEHISISFERLHKARRMHDLGRSSQSDVIELEAQLANDSLIAVQYDMLWRLSLSGLRQLMNFPSDEDLLLQGFQGNQLFFNVGLEIPDNTMFLAKEILPEIKMLEYKLKASKKNLAIAKGNFFPSLYLSTSWASGYYETTSDTDGNIISFKDQVIGNAQKNIGLNLYIPIFTGLSNYSATQKAKVNYEVAKTDYDRGLKEIEHDIHKNILELEAARKEYNMASINKEKQELAFKTAEKKLEKGLLNLIDYADMKNMYAQSQSELLRAGIQLYLKYRIIQFYLTGKIL